VVVRTAIFLGHNSLIPANFKHVIINDKSPAKPSFCFEPVSPLQERSGSRPSNFYAASTGYGGG